MVLEGKILRLFIAALIPEKEKKEISDYINVAGTIFQGVRWERSNKIHITLKFIGKADKETADKIGNLLNYAVNQLSPITLEYLHVDALPNFKRPRVIVIKLAENKELLELKKIIDKGLNEYGIEEDERDYIPHITIGRVKKDFKVKGAVSKFERKKFVIDNIALVRSRQTKGGSEYQNLGVYKLT